MDLFLVFVAAHKFSKQSMLILSLLLIGMEKGMWPNSGQWAKWKTSGKDFLITERELRQELPLLLMALPIFLDGIPSTPTATS